METNVGFSSSDESFDEHLLTLLIIRRRRKRRAERRFRVNPLWKRRKEAGVHENLYTEMAMFDPLMFRAYVRMTVVQYETLLQKVGPKLISVHTREDIITPSQKLMIALRYLATGESQFRIGVATIHVIIPKVLKVIWDTLQPIVLKIPESPDEWQKIINDFNEKWQFPHCWGAMDGMQVIMEAQPHSGSMNFNYKYHHSLNLLAVCDENYKFIAVDVGARGRENDGGVLRLSNLGKRLFDCSLNLPPPSEIYPGSSLIPQVCVADEAFPSGHNIVLPYPGRSKDRMPNDQRIFNYRLSRAWRTIENTFGIMASQWRIFRTYIKGNVQLIKFIILGAVCLHNFLRQSENNLPEDLQYYCPRNFVDKIEDGREVDGEWRRDFRIDYLAPLPAVRNENLNAVLIREEFKKFFLNEGQVPWQQRRVDEGSF